MARPKGSKTVYFSKVREARELLRDKAIELFEGYMILIKDAHAAQEFEVAANGYQFLMKHLPKDEDGITLLDSPVDKTGKDSGPKGPTIQIGIALGPKPELKALPPIDIEVDEQN